MEDAKDSTGRLCDEGFHVSEQVGTNVQDEDSCVCKEQHHLPAMSGSHSHEFHVHSVGTVHKANGDSPCQLRGSSPSVLYMRGLPES